jgi:hypothetical protein
VNNLCSPVKNIPEQAAEGETMSGKHFRNYALTYNRITFPSRLNHTNTSRCGFQFMGAAPHSLSYHELYVRG